MGHQILGRPTNGEVSERFKEPVLKTGDSERGRGFESHPLRQRRNTRQTDPGNEPFRRNQDQALEKYSSRLKRTVC